MMNYDTIRFRRLFNRRRLTPQDGCLLWPANQLDADGYGLLKYKGGADGRQVKAVRAHRLSYLLNRGPIPEDMEILHSCDNPRCVSPFHLSVGTRLENEQDKARKGRTPRGQQKSALLTDEQAQDVLNRYRDGESITLLALEHDIPYKTCEAICLRTRWKYLK